MSRLARPARRVAPSGLCACVVLLAVTSVSAADLGQYRDFRLGSSTAEVVKAAGSSGRDVKTLHARPALLQEMNWRAPYSAARAPAAVDPVGSMIFSFVDDQLYKIVVLYAPSRIEGLTTADMIAALSPAYGPPASRSARPRGGDDALNATVPVAQWRNGYSVVTLQYYQYSGGYELVIASPSLERLASKAEASALVLDAREAPAREAALLKRQAEAAQVEAERTRLKNKEAFRP
ncbi:MAG: hypothetical protein A3F70_09265 [Acidobacteria bacterium RIFCSPLOWO2_12_FULL_67_14]|nr:MAG: hypothetical protein A3F70_09265 [Acidobacteria bacterium RIFCSPLOWO2_12_FULL_67_14]